MIKLRDRIQRCMDEAEAAHILNELMGIETTRSMKECLMAMLNHAGVTVAEVYQAKKARLGKRACYFFSFLSAGRRYMGWIDASTLEVLKFRFQAA